jgi:predicted phosphoribosyltransferase
LDFFPAAKWHNPQPEMIGMFKFQNRAQAGRLLARKLARYGHREDVLVLALPRGGMPVAFEVANILQSPLDIFVVRKLGVPGEEELAIGAIASGGIRVLNDYLIDRVGISNQVIDAVSAREQAELERRELAYRGHAARPQVGGKTVILVDDGIATGSTMRAAIAALRPQDPSRLVIAVPTSPLSSLHALRKVADEVVTVISPVLFHSVGQWYVTFTQTSDHEVRQLFELSKVSIE